MVLGGQRISSGWSWTLRGGTGDPDARDQFDRTRELTTRFSGMDTERRYGHCMTTTTGFPVKPEIVSASNGVVVRKKDGTTWNCPNRYRQYP